ncbi:hypothetical protein Plav_1429 [Parvibaculum lavamentivorans DS-1]|uniref:Glycine zipper family protein n=1 Tax=Parvibaculum lavamentivorans (strain DS-1 / DSM 13023 / NCIMB 13966) TaxID=402881 RepID=A7HT16_PARL1|nr:hypothetical protein [Parvibaculum lavamentivorans]ABS63049.1 hypothetical protein Plav_1429 [Parvibaculum lavamentivorans DS-1]
MNGSTIGSGIAIDLGLGTIIGLRMDDLGVGIGMGIGIGLAMAIGIDQWRKKKDGK